MKILHVIRDLSPETGGPVTAVMGLAATQTAKGHDVKIATTDFGLMSKPEVPGVKVNAYPCGQSNWRRSLPFKEALPILVRDADLVHIHTLWEYPSLLAGKVCKSMGKPYIIRPCGMLDRWSLSQKGWKKRIYLKLALSGVFRGASGFHFTSPGELENSLGWGPKENGFVVPVGLPTEAYQNLPPEDAFGQRFPDLSAKQIILYLSRIHYKKQPDVAIKAFSKIHHKFPGTVLVMAGPGEADYIDRLKALCRESGIKNKVYFTGMLGRDAVREALVAADLFVLPSLQENFGIAAVEAMAAGCPVLVSDQIDLAEAIQKNNAGIACSADADTVASVFSKVLQDEVGLTNMAMNAKKMVLKNYTWETVVNQLDAAYENILNGLAPSEIRK